LPVDYSIEPATSLNVASRNNLPQKPKTEYSPCRPSLSPVMCTSGSVLGSATKPHDDVLSVVTRFSVILFCGPNLYTILYFILFTVTC